MANVPSYTTDRFSFGPGILYIGVEGTTPVLDIGAVRGDAEFTLTRTPLEVKAGSPQTLIKQYVIEEKASLRLTSIEWNLNNMPYLFGAGVTSVSGPVDTLGFGGDQNISERALRYLHIMPDGSTIDLQIFRAQPAGEQTISFKETDLHEIPFEFNVIEGASQFTGAATVANQKLFKIIHTRAA